MRNIIVALSVCFVLAGCAAKPLEVASITSIKPTNGAIGTDVYARQRAAGTLVPEYNGDQLLEVRTYEYVQEKGTVEMAGAKCNVSAGSFTASMTTPAKVRVPLYRNQSESLAVKCNKQGYKSKMITLKAFDKTRADRFNNMTSAGSAGGLIGVVASAAIAGAVDAASDNNANVWQYPPAKITLENTGKKRPQSSE
ncbi:MAG: hypothetical protein AAFR90_12600 [Pseudomonadota bacterium]